MTTIVAPPVTLSMEEYRRDWQPHGWQLLIIGPTATWRQEWGEWEAIRDIVQNALDAAEEYQWYYDDQGLVIADHGSGIQIADFLLGPPKLKPPHARGKFGEGMKIAALVLLRAGYPVKVDTVDREIWMVFLEQKTNGHANSLSALWRPNGTGTGTRFHIIGYRGSAFEDRFAVNIPKSSIIHEGPSKLADPIRRYNQLISYPAGRIYARDIYLKDIDSPWSYNLWSFDMAPDRHGPASEGDMHVDMGRLWCTVTDVDLLEQFLTMVTAPPATTTYESRNVALDAWSMGSVPGTDRRYYALIADNASFWQEAWQRIFGNNAVIRTSDRWDGTVKHLGYYSVSVAWNCEAALRQAINYDVSLVQESQERLREVEVVPDERLTPRQLAHLELSREIAGKWHYPGVAAVHAAIIPPASDRMRTAGLYQMSTREIFIATDQLERASTTVDTVVHEIAHHISEAEDGQPGHYTQMTAVAARVVELTAAGYFDDLLKEAVW
ncbi:MAG: hypothetical protein SVP26_08920 [Chloroflexota bacterium]|nr:hypothetical protein [Chloroflexota bacterium]